MQDDEHRFELATQLGKLQMAADIIVSISAQAQLGGVVFSGSGYCFSFHVKFEGFVICGRC